MWDNTRVPVKLTTDDVEQVSKQLEAALKGTTPLDPRVAYQAASFYYDNNKDMTQAAKWVDQAIEKNPERLLHAFQARADSSETGEQERGHRFRAKDDRDSESGQAAGRSRRSRTRRR